jgi:autotransporter-associated beta strand protein
MRGSGEGSGAVGARHLAEIGIFVTTAFLGVILATCPALGQTQTFIVPAGTSETQTPPPIADGVTQTSVIEEGGGTLVFNLVNTYTGTTTITAGTLALENNSAVADSSAVILTTAGATLDISNSGATTTVLALMGPSGTLVNLGANRLLIDTSSSVSTYAGEIEGTGGSLVKDGAGTLTLSGINSYTGATTVNAGTLALGAGGSLVTSSGIDLAASGAAFDISNGGSKTIQNLTGVGGSAVTLGANTLTLGTATATTFAGDISGAGGKLVKQGTGIFTLSGTNSYTGGTTIAAGTLTGTTSSLPGNILDDATLVFNQSSAGTYSGSLSGAGTLLFQGGGEVTLTGNSAGFAGTTTVSSGDLAVGSASTTSAELGGDVIVTSGAAVSGHGTIGGTLTNTSGVVAPGGSVGTLTINGNYTQGPAGTLAVQLTPAGASKLVVAGTVSLQGSLDILSGPNGYVPFSKYVILTSGGGISGTFQTVTASFPVIPHSVQYETNEIYLQLSGFTGLTPNQTAVANILNSRIAGASGDFLNMLNLAVVLPAQQMQQTLSSLGGQIYANLGDVALQDRRIFLEALTDRTRSLGGAWPSSTFGGIQGAWGGSDNALKFAQLGNALSAHDQQIMSDVSSYVSPPSGAVGGYWARGFGQFGTLDSNSSSLGSTYATGGGIIGADVISNPRAVLGLAVSGGQSSVTLSTNPETGTISFFQGGIYGAKELDNGVVVDGAAIYAHDSYDVTRGIVLPGASRNAASSHGGDDGVAELGVGRTFFYDDLRVLPRAELSYFHIGQSGFTETGAGSLDLSVSPANLDALYTRVGVTLVKPILFGDTAIVPELRAAWLHNILDNYGQFSAAFAGAPTASFTQIGAPMGRDAADLGAGVSFGIARTSFGGELSGFIQYEAWLAEHEIASAVGAGVRLKW